MLCNMFVRADKWITILSVNFQSCHSLHGAILLNMAEKIHKEASSESINASRCLNVHVIKYFIPQSAPNLCKTSAAISKVNIGIKQAINCISSIMTMNVIKKYEHVNK